MQATDPHCKALLWELSAWMSEGSDREQKPVTHKRETTASGADRPKRLTRRDVDYSNSGEGGSVPGQQQLQGVVYREVSQQSSLRGIRECSTESIWGGSAVRWRNGRGPTQDDLYKKANKGILPIDLFFPRDSHTDPWGRPREVGSATTAANWAISRRIAGAGWQVIGQLRQDMMGHLQDISLPQRQRCPSQPNSSSGHLQIQLASVATRRGTSPQTALQGRTR